MVRLSAEEKEHLIETAVEFDKLDVQMQRMLGVIAELLKVAAENNHEKTQKEGE